MGADHGRKFMAVAEQNRPGNLLRLRLFGDLEVYRGDEAVELPPSKRTRALLIYLALTGQTHRRDRLCSLLWEIPDDPRGALRWSLSKLRPVVDDSERPRLLSDRKAISLELSDVWIDALELKRLVKGDLSKAPLGALREAADQIRGGFLENLELRGADAFQAWLVAQRREFAGHQEKLLKALVDRLSDTPNEAVPYARLLTQLFPGDQTGRKWLLNALIGAGLVDEARQEAELARAWLQKSGTEPTTELEKALEAALTAPEQTGEPEPQVIAFPKAPDRQNQDRQDEASRRSPPQAAARPLIGRESAMQVFDGMLDAARTRGRGGTLLLHGEPGVGKSKLLRAFRQHAMDARMRFFDTRSIWTEGQPVFWTWGELVHQLPRCAPRGGRGSGWGALCQRLGPIAARGPGAHGWIGRRRRGRQQAFPHQ